MVIADFYNVFHTVYSTRGQKFYTFEDVFFLVKEIMRNNYDTMWQKTSCH